MDKKYQLLVTDMDGSLLSEDKTITKYTKKLITEALALGKDIAVCTGRGLKETIPFIEEIPNFRYVIFANGSCIYDRKKDKMIAERFIHTDTVQYTMDYISSKDILVYANMDHGSITDRYRIRHMENYYAKQFEGLFRKMALQVNNIPEYYEENPQLKFYKINLFHRSGIDREKTLETLKNAQLPASYTIGDESNIEISPEGINKGCALSELCRYLNLQKEKVIYVGDSWNDLSAMRYAGLAVAMGNAEADVKKACRIETADCDHDGVGRVIDRYLLLRD